MALVGAFTVRKQAVEHAIICNLTPKSQSIRFEVDGCIQRFITPCVMFYPLP